MQILYIILASSSSSAGEEKDKHKQDKTASQEMSPINLLRILSLQCLS